MAIMYTTAYEKIKMFVILVVT